MMDIGLHLRIYVGIRRHYGAHESEVGKGGHWKRRAGTQSSAESCRGFCSSELLLNVRIQGGQGAGTDPGLDNLRVGAASRHSLDMLNTSHNLPKENPRGHTYASGGKLWPPPYLYRM